MAIAYVQSKSISSTGTTSTTVAVTMTSSVTAGNLLAVFLVFADAGFISCVDSLGNTFTPVDQSALFSGDISKTLYAKNIAAGADTITVTLDSAVGYRSLVVHEISGADLSAPIDQHIINTQTTPGTGANAITSTAKTTVNDGEYIFGAVHISNVGVGKTVAAGSSFTDRESIDGGADSAPLESEEQVQSSAGSIAATFTGTGIAGDNAHVALMTFIASAPLAPAVVPTMYGMFPKPTMRQPLEYGRTN